VNQYDNEAVARAFGNTLRAARTRRGISQDTFAKIVGIDRACPSRLERGKAVPTLTNLFRLAEGLGIKASRLMVDLERQFDDSGSMK
jgi:transcriptional regulator with XRE-family HTH domain